ncbi:IMPACT family protein [Glaciecola petra]|uniref:YigZ family protein n=1 Tax=Glaciecola petra TaxID=3075602 RepID=A0ABU2ZSR3_9ALTE|nr:YigZ family protein [Aestuariibacter sp. P117]MDT0595680.1 YigZ family protein [Aestuariibacter sp. P117]
MSHKIVTQTLTNEIQVKKSRFIATIDSVSNIGQASKFIVKQKEVYRDAGHHCFAYIIGPPNIPKTSACSDDGEPKGTAGKPILNVLNNGVIGDCIILVSRYFGGIKLGTGGLVSAYTAAANKVYRAVRTKPFIQTLKCRIKCNFSQEQFIRHLLKQYNGDINECIYTNELYMDISIPLDAKYALQEDSLKHKFFIIN